MPLANVPSIEVATKKQFPYVKFGTIRATDDMYRERPATKSQSAEDPATRQTTSKSSSLKTSKTEGS